jgi:hypothetical protein
MQWIEKTDGGLNDLIDVQVTNKDTRPSSLFGGFKQSS